MPTTNRPDHIPSRAKILTARDRKAKLRRVMLTTWYGFHLDGLSVRDIAELVGASPAKVHWDWPSSGSTSGRWTVRPRQLQG
jgi:hypothetical protein